MSGCAASSDDGQRFLPPPPAYLRPAAEPAHRDTDDWETIAKAERAGRLTNERVILAVRGDWKALQASYGGR